MFTFGKVTPLEKAESEVIIEAMNKAKGSFKNAARYLGITRQGLRGKIKRLGLKLRPFFKDET